MVLWDAQWGSPTEVFALLVLELDVLVAPSVAFVPLEEEGQESFEEEQEAQLAFAPLKKEEGPQEAQPREIQLVEAHVWEEEPLLEDHQGSQGQREAAGT